jgi:hypothetical protein
MCLASLELVVCMGNSRWDLVDYKPRAGLWVTWNQKQRHGDIVLRDARCSFGSLTSHVCTVPDLLPQSFIARDWDKRWHDKSSSVSIT